MAFNFKTARKSFDALSHVILLDTVGQQIIPLTAAATADTGFDTCGTTEESVTFF